MLKIEYVPIESIKPYENNAKEHPKEQIKQIKKSIKEFGNNDPIAVWHNEIVEGHGRYEALKQLDMDKIPIIRLDNLTDEQRKAYTLIHNKLTMNSDFNFDILTEELNNIVEIDMTEYGFDFGVDIEDEDEGENPYTTRINIPQYEIKGEQPKIEELFDSDKYNKLVENINKSNISEEQKDFLLKAATRHLGFNYSKVAEYYAHQDKEMQELMEESALVIIDYYDAIKNGYVEISKSIEQMKEESLYDED